MRYVPGGWTAVTAHAHFVRPAPGGELRCTRATHIRPGERIALLIHGFADDSSEEACWLTQLVRKPTAPAYDRILCFEWESLHTDVRERAKRLKDTLTIMGLDEVPGVEIDLFAHSMGALVAHTLRGTAGWRRPCAQLLLYGTAQPGHAAGRDSALYALAACPGAQPAAPTPPSLLISWAMGAVAWDMAGPRAMVPGSALLEELNGTRGTARLNYHVLAGNAWESAGGQGERWMSALSAGLNSSAHWFYEGDNDWVVGVRSCLTVPVVNYPGGVLLRGRESETYGVLSQRRGDSARVDVAGGAAYTGQRPMKYLLRLAMAVRTRQWSAVCPTANRRQYDAKSRFARLLHTERVAVVSCAPCTGTTTATQAMQRGGRSGVPGMYNPSLCHAGVNGR